MVACNFFFSDFIFLLSSMYISSFWNFCNVLTSTWTGQRWRRFTSFSSLSVSFFTFTSCEFFFSFHGWSSQVIKWFCTFYIYSQQLVCISQSVWLKDELKSWRKIFSVASFRIIEAANRIKSWPQSIRKWRDVVDIKEKGRKSGSSGYISTRYR